MSTIDVAPDRAAVLRAARDDDLWQEDDQRTTNEYLQIEFGLADPLRDVTKEADAAARDGLIQLHIGSYGARQWELTAKGEQVLAQLDAKEQ